jgi:hypothetical protein
MWMRQMFGQRSGRRGTLPPVFSYVFIPKGFKLKVRHFASVHYKGVAGEFLKGRIPKELRRQASGALHPAGFRGGYS